MTAVFRVILIIWEWVANLVWRVGVLLNNNDPNFLLKRGVGLISGDYCTNLQATPLALWWTLQNFLEVQKTTCIQPLWICILTQGGAICMYRILHASTHTLFLLPVKFLLAQVSLFVVMFKTRTLRRITAQYNYYSHPFIHYDVMVGTKWKTNQENTCFWCSLNEKHKNMPVSL